MKDILDLDNIESIVRQIFESRGSLVLDDFSEQQGSKIPKNYKPKILRLKTGDSFEMGDTLHEYLRKFKQLGYDDSVYNALYEAVLNAFQHGNQKDSSKKIWVGYRDLKDCINVMVEDQGSPIDPNFVPFILYQRQAQEKLRNGECKDEDIKWFYDFAEKEVPDGNFGKGIKEMHKYVDQVRFYHSSRGGLVVHLIKNRNNVK